MKQMLKFLLVISFLALLIASGCATQPESHEELEMHATAGNVGHCFEDHAGEPHEETLAHCQEEICGTDSHCFEEVEEFAQALQ